MTVHVIGAGHGRIGSLGISTKIHPGTPGAVPEVDRIEHVAHRPT